MLLSQDTLRREILHVREDSRHPTPQLLQALARFGWENDFTTVITEGIWGAGKNGWVLKELAQEADEAYIYYFDIPFDETVRRHSTKPNAHDFGEEDMRRWWKEKDYLGIEGEQTITATMTQEQTMEKIIHDIKKGEI